MNVYDNILNFNGIWRSYQERVLKQAETYRQDGKIHIVAPPGSGKTTLGIELLSRLGCPALILSPRIVIREQWLERIREAFLDRTENENCLSNDIKAPKLITSITYQTLYSAMTRFQGQTQEEESEEEIQEVDYSEFDLVKTVRDAGIGVVCLDECHHLRSEWWKTLEVFMKELQKNDIQVISLTATPPYDSTPAQWERYISLCGAIDEEIIVPELVREQSRCPHQDYVYFNFPTKEEEAKVSDFRRRAKRQVNDLMTEERFARIIASHCGLSDYEAFKDSMLEEPPYLSALLIFAQKRGIMVDKRWKRLLGVSHLPTMDETWMEILLQKLLFDDIERFTCDASYREALIRQLKREQFIVRRKVGLTDNESIQKLMINSLGKIKSIKAIADAELSGMKENLRMLILTDYIKKEYLSYIGHPEKEMKEMGVLPLFEILRREFDNTCSLGVLCGSVVILPMQAIPYLEEVVKRRYGREEALMAKELTDENGRTIGYVQVTIAGKPHDTTRFITEVFEAGYIQILVGTKSLLGEGWDSPCINSLILASFVGSFVLSNQMRGRAIRVMKGNPQKTSNIWHLVCIENQKDVKTMRRMGLTEEILSADYATLKRRMKGFLGVSYQGHTIENGMERLNIIGGPYNHAHVQEINRQMIALAADREKLRTQWDESILLYDKMEIADEYEVSKKEWKQKAAFLNIIGLMLVDIVCLVSFQAISVTGNAALQREGIWYALIYWGVMLFLAERLIELSWKGIKYITPLRYLKQIGAGIQKALEVNGQLKSCTRVEVDDGGGALYQIYLKGGTTREKDLFSTCVEEFFGSVDNQRYLLCRNRAGLGMMNYFCVPELFAKTKDDALSFAVCMKKAIGKYHLVYTRNPAGRKTLLKARARAYGSLAQRQIQQMSGGRRKKVKGALE